jgi:lipopolysaccharide/colanic/teichoic acid biosynthesis glycosyltransferase
LTIVGYEQLSNVLVGKTGVVGARPLIPEGDRLVEDSGRPRRVLERSEIPSGETAGLAPLYATGWSPTRHVRLIVRTLPSLFGPRRAC